MTPTDKAAKIRRSIGSSEIECYQRFGFCEEAEATFCSGKAGVSLTSFDILRWDQRELIAVDSTPICAVDTLRFDFVAKKVAITMALLRLQRQQEGQHHLLLRNHDVPQPGFIRIALHLGQGQHLYNGTKKTGR